MVRPLLTPPPPPRRVAGGFFGSGFKRAFKMKDFGDTIPGHGGVTDRFDCQMIMAMFAYLYYWNYVASTQLGVGEALEVGAGVVCARCAAARCAARAACSACACAPLACAASMRLCMRCCPTGRRLTRALHAVMQVALRLEEPQLLELWAKLGNLLLGEGLLPGSVEPALQAALRTVANSSVALRGGLPAGA